MVIRQIPFLFLLSISITSYGQQAAIATTQTRLLYRHVDNNVNISVPGYSCGDLRLQSATCRILGDSCNYVVTPDSSLPTAVFTIYSKKRGRVIDTIKIPVKPLPRPHMVVVSGNNDVGAILKEGPHIAGEGNVDLSKYYQVVNFSVMVLHANTVMYEHIYKTSKYKPEFLAIIEHAKPGDVIIWEDVKVKDPDNMRRTLNDLKCTKMPGDGNNWRMEVVR